MVFMSGHNKWSKIKNKKAASDAVKSKIFSKLVRLIQVESRRAGGNESDPGLRAAIEKAKKESMPKENIDRAIKKGAGGEGANMEVITYETYGPGGIAIMIQTLTDNRNRTAAEIKHILSLQGYELANPGSAAWAFRKEGGELVPTTTIPLSSDEDGEKLSNLIEVLEEQDDVQDIYTNAE
jgi:YebC/PmpR family DNA-binding regulatory protein